LWEKEARELSAAGEPPAEAAVLRAAWRLLKGAQDGLASVAAKARIIRQRLRVEQSAVYAVTYEFSGKRYACWASALDGRVAAEESPFSELAARWACEAQRLASAGKTARAEELLAKAAALGGEAFGKIRLNARVPWPRRALAAVLCGVLPALVARS
jgi:hypothetical protein